MDIITVVMTRILYDFRRVRGTGGDLKMRVSAKSASNRRIYDEILQYKPQILIAL
jgi:hypothetical protein